MAEIKAEPAVSEEAKISQEKKADALAQQISVLSMQLIQLQNRESDSI